MIRKGQVGPKSVNSKAELQAIKANLVSTTQ